MSGRKRKGGEGGPKWGLIVGVLIGLMLAANLVVGFFPTGAREAAGPAVKSTGFLTPDLLWGLAFWGPLSALIAAGSMAIFWSSAAWNRTERGSLRWARAAFVFTVVAGMLIAMATFDRTLAEYFRRRELITLTVFFMAVQTVLFALGARDDHVSGGRGRRRSGRKDDDDAGGEDDSALVPELP